MIYFLNIIIYILTQMASLLLGLGRMVLPSLISRAVPWLARAFLGGHVSKAVATSAGRLAATRLITQGARAASIANKARVVAIPAVSVISAEIARRKRLAAEAEELARQKSRINEPPTPTKMGDKKTRVSTGMERVQIAPMGNPANQATVVHKKQKDNSRRDAAVRAAKSYRKRK